MLVLVETPAGYGLFKVNDDGLTTIDAEGVASHFETSASAQNKVSLHAFSKFKETKDAMDEAAALIESKLGKGLKKFLKSNIVKKNLTDKLAISDKALGQVIAKDLGIDIVFSPSTHEIIRGIRGQLHSLVAGLAEKDTRAMALGLSHSLNRFKLKFSADKVDTMIIQAIGLLDDLDRELNNFAMRLKEWYGWHFPELAKIVTDNSAYAATVKAIGFRVNTKQSDLSDIIPTELEAEVKQAAEVSMGTEIVGADLTNINELADRVSELTEYRTSLADYLKFRMNAIAPNLTHMVGELVGARLISHSGSLMGLAKHPSSTVQILGAEKALFRALKTKSATPKYGLIYHATLVGQTAPKLKGKISRVLAAKLSLCIRCDALGDQEEVTVGIQNRLYVERKLDELSADPTRRVVKGVAFVKPDIQKYEPTKDVKASIAEQYNAAADEIDTPAIVEVSEEKATKKRKADDPEAKAKKKAKKEKKLKEAAAAATA